MDRPLQAPPSQAEEGMNGWIRGPAVAIVVKFGGLRVGDQVIPRVKHHNNYLNNKVCVITRLGAWSGAYTDGDQSGSCTYIAEVDPVRSGRVNRPRHAGKFRSGELGLIADDIV